MKSGSVTLDTIVKSKEYPGLICVCGESFMNRQITGVHIIDNPDTVRFFRTGEIVMTTGYILQYFSDEELKKFLRHLCERGCSGIVFKINRFYDCVPDNIMNYAQDYDIPIVTMPYKYAMADVQAYILRLIFMNDYHVENETDLLISDQSNLDYFNDLLTEVRQIEMEQKARGYNFNLSYCCILLWGISVKTDVIDNYFKEIFIDLGVINYSIQRGGQIAYIIGKKDFSKENDLSFIGEKIKSNIDQWSQQNDLYIGVGNIVETIMQIRESIEQAYFAIMWQRKKRADRLSFYCQNEMMFLMYQEMQKKSIELLYINILKPIVDYDIENRTELIRTLRELIASEWDLKKTSENLFIHRNTLLKRREKIESLIKSNCGMEKSSALQIGIYAYDILTYFY